MNLMGIPFFEQEQMLPDLAKKCQESSVGGTGKYGVFVKREV